MTKNRPLHRPSPLSLAVLAAAWLGLLNPSPGLAGSIDEPTGRQLVMFGVLATPGGTTMDPKIPPVVAARLRKTLPNHGFKLIKVKSDRVVAGGTLALDLGGGFETRAQLIKPHDANGKVQMRFGLLLDGLPQFQSVVTTPADQFNFFDKALPDDSHLLIGVGAR